MYLIFQLGKETDCIFCIWYKITSEEKKKTLRRRGIEPRPHPWKGWILTIRPTTLHIYYILSHQIASFISYIETFPYQLSNSNKPQIHMYTNIVFTYSKYTNHYIILTSFHFFKMISCYIAFKKYIIHWSKSLPIYTYTE